MSIQSRITRGIGFGAVSVSMLGYGIGSTSRLKYWNGATWVNKHSILNTGKTLDTDVDISNGGTYPDAPGYWRVRVNPDSATADFIQGIVKIKHSLDS